VSKNNQRQIEQSKRAQAVTAMKVELAAYVTYLKHLEKLMHPTQGGCGLYELKPCRAFFKKVLKQRQYGSAPSLRLVRRVLDATDKLIAETWNAEDALAANVSKDAFCACTRRLDACVKDVLRLVHNEDDASL